MAQALSYASDILFFFSTHLSELPCGAGAITTLLSVKNLEFREVE